MSFTKGPWKIMPGESAPRICVDGDKDFPVVVVVSGHSDEGIMANQHLIASAPEMYEALKEAKTFISRVLEENESTELVSENKTYQKIEAVLKKATGEP